MAPTEPRARQWRAEQKIVPADGKEQDFFGGALAIAGDTLLVGAERRDDGAKNAGAAYVFVRRGQQWVEEQKMLAADGKADDDFGSAVALGRGFAVIGASHHGARAEHAGAAYVFAKAGEGWKQEQKLLASDGRGGDFFGQAVAVSGSTVLVGASGQDGLGKNSGAVYVFDRRGNQTVETQKLLASDGRERDTFGRALALSGDTALVGANAHWLDDKETGAAYVFVRRGERWVEEARLSASDKRNGDMFGVEVALDGDTALVSARGREVPGRSNGSVFVFLREQGKWVEQQQLVPKQPTPDESLGWRLAIAGNVALVSSIDRESKGAVRVFVRRGQSFVEEQKLLASDGAPYDFFGQSLARFDVGLVIGAHNHAASAPMSGAAYSFVLAP